MRGIDIIGADWLCSEAAKITDHIDHITPVEFNEMYRYLPSSLAKLAGIINFDLTPYMREIVNCFDINSDVREVSVKKATQVAYTTMLECIILYMLFYLKTKGVIFFTAEADMAKARIEASIIPMILLSGFEHMISSSDIGNKRKTGKSGNMIQVVGGGFLTWYGALNPTKARMWSVPFCLKDEIDGWKDVVGKDGDPDKLTDQRVVSFENESKIFRGSTPLEAETSKIEKAFLRGDQRRYFCKCLSPDCRFPQYLRWSGNNKDTGHDFGMKWDLDDGQLVPDSVRYVCMSCGHDHYEHDKELFFAADNAEWKPTARPKKPGIRSYHVPAMLSAPGMRSWAQCVSEYLEAVNPVTGRIVDVGKLQSFYNNILGEPFRKPGGRVRENQVSAHRRKRYKFGQIPNHLAEQHSGSKILFLTCQVDVQLHDLAVSVMGWTKGARCYLIDYWRFEDDHVDGVARAESEAWTRLEDLIDNKVYSDNNGINYKIALTLIDCGYQPLIAANFAARYNTGVYGIIGRSNAGKNSTFVEFSQFTTKAGIPGFRLAVNLYKDRMASVLRRDWVEGEQQDPYHFNAPDDVTKKQLAELTKEIRTEKTDDHGFVSYSWDRIPSAANELWDLLGYGYAAVDILAWSFCMLEMEEEQVNMPVFWEWIEKHETYFTRD